MKYFVTFSFGKYPIPKYIRHDSNRIFLWMGNIGPYIGYEDVRYNSFPDQLYGCLDEFHINGDLISFNNDGVAFNSTCGKNNVMKNNNQTHKCVNVLKCLNDNSDDRQCWKGENK